MHLLFTLLLVISEIPTELYSSFCSKDALDSVYTDCRQMAVKDYPGDVDAGAEYYLADWAYGVSLLDLSDVCLDKVLGARLSDKTLRADCLSLASVVSRLQGNLAEAIGYAEECLAIDRENGDEECISSSVFFYSSRCIWGFPSHTEE